MKNIIILFSLLGVVVSSAQEFYFDRLIQYQENEDKTIQLLYNTENSEYYLLLNDSPSEASADLFDKNKKQIHHFKVTKPQEVNGIIYNYVYDSSDKLLQEKSNKKLTYDFETKREDKYYKFTALSIYEAEKTQSPYLKADLTMRFTHEDKFDAFNLCCFLGPNYLGAVRPDDKFVVVRAKITDQLGKIFEYKLISDQVIQFRLKVPAKNQKEVIKLRSM